LTFCAGDPKSISTLSIRADVGEFRRASDWLLSHAQSFETPQQLQSRLDLCLNEALANAVAYGGESSLKYTIDLSLRFWSDVGARKVAVTISDSGAPFDPVSAIAKPRPTTLATAEAGGHGILMMQAFADDLRYEYRDQRNHLTFEVHWEASA